MSGKRIALKRGEPPRKRAKQDESESEKESESEGSERVEDWATLTVKVLREHCRRLGLSTSGLKRELVERLGRYSGTKESDGEDTSLEEASEASDNELHLRLSEEDSDSLLVLLSDSNSGEELTTHSKDHLNGAVDEEELAEAMKERLKAGQDVPSCPHLSHVQRKLVQEVALNPTKWRCQDCGTTASVWVCLTCGFVGCGRVVSGHMGRHAKSAEHFVAIEVNTTDAFCYGCNDSVGNDNEGDDLGKLRECLTVLASHNLSSAQDSEDEKSSVEAETVHPRRRLQRRASQFIMRPKEHDLEDCLATSQKHYRNNLLSQAFEQWKRMVDHRRLSLLTSFDSTSSEEEDSPFLVPVQVPSRISKAPSIERKLPLLWGSRTTPLELPKPAEMSTESESDSSQSFRAPLSGSKRRLRTISLSESESPSLDAPMEAKKDSFTTPTLPTSLSQLRTPRLSGLLQSPRSVLLTPGQTGLRNLGNSCFLNAVIQALSSLVELRNYLITDLLPQGSAVPLGNRLVTRTDTLDCFELVRNKDIMRSLQAKEISVCLELHRLFRVIWSGKNAVITPYSLFFAIWKLLPDFSNYKQQDAEELLSFLLERMDEELTEAIKPSRGRRALSPTIIDTLCRGTLTSSISCSLCGFKSSREERFRELTLNIPPSQVTTSRPQRNSKSKAPMSSVPDLIRHFFCPEPLSGYRCEGCKRADKCQKEVSITAAPKLLCLVVNRFFWSSRGRAKINTIVTYPLTLAIPHCQSEFKLKSAVLHHGYSLNSGHYTALTYNDMKEQWFHCNDNTVQPITTEAVLKKADNSAYILFYFRED